MRTITSFLGTFFVLTALSLVTPSVEAQQCGITQTPGYVCTPCGEDLWMCEPPPGGGGMAMLDSGVEGSTTATTDGATLDSLDAVQLFEITLGLTLL